MFHFVIFLKGNFFYASYKVSLFSSYIFDFVYLVPLESNCTIFVDLSYPIWSVFLVIYLWLYYILKGDRRFCGKRCSIWLEYIELRTWLNQFEILVSSLIHERILKTVMFYQKTVLIEYHINRESFYQELII